MRARVRNAQSLEQHKKEPHSLFWLIWIDQELHLAVETEPQVIGLMYEIGIN